MLLQKVTPFSLSQKGNKQQFGLVWFGLVANTNESSSGVVSIPHYGILYQSNLTGRRLKGKSFSFRM